jgi:heptosyltransferase-1
MSTHAERILLIQLHHLGDVVLATPAIRATRRAFPNARIDFLTGPLGAQALDRNPHLDHILVKPGRRDLLRTRYDVVLDMHSVPTTAWSTFATRAPVRIGIRGRGPRNLAYTYLVEREKNAVYMARQKMRLLEVLGCSPDVADVELEISVSKRDQNRAVEILSALPQPLVAVSPVAKHAFKQWGAERWAAVADALAEAGASILITSGPGEDQQARDVASRMRHSALWQYDRTSVRSLVAMYQQCALWIGNDGGPKHLAVAAGIPTLTVYRRQLGRVWSDEADPKQVAINSGGETLDSISVETVIMAAQEMLR